jgi:translation initiation factor 3 subunit D
MRILLTLKSKFCGSLEYYDKSYDRINTKTPISSSRLKRINRVYHKVTTTDDPVIRSVSLFEENETILLDSI